MKGVCGGCGSMRHFFFVSASLCGDIVLGGIDDEDAPVIHMGMIVGMRGVSIRMRPLKGDEYRGSNDAKEGSKRRFYDLPGGGGWV